VRLRGNGLSYEPGCVLLWVNGGEKKVFFVEGCGIARNCPDRRRAGIQLVVFNVRHSFSENEPLVKRGSRGGWPGKLGREELAELEYLVEAAGLQDKPPRCRACPAAGVYSSATAEGILGVLD
jgi:hypothetical protein